MLGRWSDLGCAVLNLGPAMVHLRPGIDFILGFPELERLRVCCASFRFVNGHLGSAMGFILMDSQQMVVTIMSAKKAPRAMARDDEMRATSHMVSSIMEASNRWVKHW